jgi:plastocyanin
MIIMFSTMFATIACESENNEIAPSTTGVTLGQTEATSNPEITRPSDPYEILLTDKGFEPLILYVPVNTTVTWHNIDRTRNMRHWIKSKDALFDTRVIPVEARATVTFTEKGEFEYYCIYHRDREEEQGKIIVE